MTRSTLGIAFSLLVATAMPARAQNGRDLLSEYSLTSWTDGDGVRLGTVSGLAQDRDGYLWIAASAGLLRFDGVRFMPWNALSDVPFPTTAASALLVASDGSLWVGLADTGVRHIRGAQMRPQDQPGGSPRSVTDLAE